MFESVKKSANKLIKNRGAIVMLALCCTTITSVAATAEMITVRVSVSTDNKQAIDTDTENYEARPAISDDGRFVVFESVGYTLVENDTNEKSDIFLRDRELQTTVRITKGIKSEQANGGSYSPKITGDGRYIVFTSDASNLVSDDTNNIRDIFIYDFISKTTERITVSEIGEQFNKMNMLPNISDDGRFIVFASLATNWGDDDINGRWDALLHDREAQKTITVNVSGGGLPNISADGQFVCFSDPISNIVENDTNGENDIFLYNVLTKQNARVNVASDGTESNGYSSLCSLSADGRYIAFQSDGTTLVSDDTNGSTDIFVHDRVLQTTERVSLSNTGEEGNNHNNYPALAKDGNYIVFKSYSTNFDNIKQGVNLFIKDRQTGDIKLVSYSTDGTERDSVDATFMHPSISGDGQHIAFQSLQTNLVQDDTNNTFDTFVHGPAVFQLEVPKEEVVEAKETSSGGGLSFAIILMLVLTNISRSISSQCAIDKI